MSIVKKWVFRILLLMIILLPGLLFNAEVEAGSSCCSPVVGKAAASGIEQYPSMPGPGKKVSIGNDHYFIYGFDKKPKLGTVIMKVEIFTKEGKKDTSFEAKADAGMPSMKGAHDTGDQPFKLSKKGDYLLPINIVMPGDWEIRLILLKEGKAIFKGRYQFDV